MASSIRWSGAAPHGTTITARNIMVLDRHYPGDVVGLTWLDQGGQQHTGKATLAAGP